MAKPKPAPPPPGEEPIRPHVEERGELALSLDGQTMIMRPTFEAIHAFEVSTGKGLLQLAQEALNRTLPLFELAQVVTECVKAWGRATKSASAQGANAPRVAELILESEGGFYAALNTVAGMLALATTGGYTAQGELKAGTTTMTTTSAVPAGN